jgi:hypothetical protein
MIEGKRGAAAVLGLKPSTLRFRMQKLEIVKPASRALETSAAVIEQQVSSFRRSLSPRRGGAGSQLKPIFDWMPAFAGTTASGSSRRMKTEKALEAATAASLSGTSAFLCTSYPISSPSAKPISYTMKAPSAQVATPTSAVSPLPSLPR